MKRSGFILITCLLALLAVFSWLWSCAERVSQSPVEDVRFDKAEEMDTSIRLCHGDDPVFAATLDDYIRCYNSLFEQKAGEGYFPPDSSRWQSSSLKNGIHSRYPSRQFRFSEDEAVYSLPTVTVYTPMEDRSIQEITLNFDEHSYTEDGFQRFHQLCADSLRVFFPDLTEAQASDLADRIISLGNENVFGSDAWFGSNAVPQGLFYRDGVGIYPYFAIGDWERFCIIPVTAERLQEFKEKGVVLYTLESPS